MGIHENSLSNLELVFWNYGVGAVRISPVAHYTTNPDGHSFLTSPVHVKGGVVTIVVRGEGLRALRTRQGSVTVTGQMRGVEKSHHRTGRRIVSIEVELLPTIIRPRYLPIIYTSEKDVNRNRPGLVDLRPIPETEGWMALCDSTIQGASLETSKRRLNDGS